MNTGIMLFDSLCVQAARSLKREIIMQTQDHGFRQCCWLCNIFIFQYLCDYTSEQFCNILLNTIHQWRNCHAIDALLGCKRVLSIIIQNENNIKLSAISYLCVIQLLNISDKEPYFEYYEMIITDQKWSQGSSYCF